MSLISKLFELFPDSTAHQIWRLRMRSTSFRNHFLDEYYSRYSIPYDLSAAPTFDNPQLKVLLLHGLRVD
ncbi:hypothetical protein, partial [Aquirufa sp. A-Brett2-W8]